jgi:hypothetical protein
MFANNPLLPHISNSVYIWNIKKLISHSLSCLFFTYCKNFVCETYKISTYLS